MDRSRGFCVRILRRYPIKYYRPPESMVSHKKSRTSTNTRLIAMTSHGLHLRAQGWGGGQLIRLSALFSARRSYAFLSRPFPRATKGAYDSASQNAPRTASRSTWAVRSVCTLFHFPPADHQSNESSTRMVKQTIGRNEAKYFTDPVLIHFLKKKFPEVEDFKLEVR